MKPKRRKRTASLSGCIRGGPSRWNSDRQNQPISSTARDEFQECGTDPVAPHRANKAAKEKGNEGALEGP